MRRHRTHRALRRGLSALALCGTGLVAITSQGAGAAGEPPSAGVPIFQAFVNQTISASVASFGWKVPPRNEPGATFQWLATTSSNGGTLVGQTNGSFVYTPQRDNCGIGFIPFTVTNPDGQSASGSLEVINAPDAVNDDFATPMSTALNANFGTNDEVGYRPSVQWYRNIYTANPSHGTVTTSPQGTMNNAAFTYNPTPGYQGYDSFEYWVECGGKTDVATVTIAVGNAGPPTSATTTTAVTTSTLPPVNCNGPHWPTVEAECGALSGTISIENNAGASGGKEVGGWDYSGTATVVLTAPAAGLYDLQIRGNAPYSPAQRTVTVNGVARRFGYTSASRSAVTVAGVSLSQGPNSLVFSRQAADENVANVDVVTAVSADPNATTTTRATTTTVATTTTTTVATTAPTTVATTAPTTAATTSAPTTVTTTRPTTTVPGACSSSGWPSVEAECALLRDNILVERERKAAGGLELGAWGYGGTATLTLLAPTAGTYDLQIRANAPYGPALRTLRINGTPRSLSVTSRDREIVVLSGVPLVSGPNDLVFERNYGDDNVVNLDVVTAVTAADPVTPTTTTTVATTTVPSGSCATWPTIEAECASLAGTIEIENHPAAVGGKELGGWDYTGTATFTVNAPASRVYIMAITAIAPYGAATRTVTINGVSTSFAITSSTRAIANVAVTLRAGSNTIVFSRVSGNDYVVNLDRISFS